MAKRFVKPCIDWMKLKEFVPPDQMRQFIMFKGKSDGYLKRAMANPPEPPKINWEEYKKLIKNKNLVDTFQKQYEEFKVPYPADPLSKKVDDEWETLKPSIKTYCDEVEKICAEAMKEINRIKALPKFDDITMEMFVDLYPKEALNPIKNPTFWPHTPEEQLGYKPENAKKG